MYCRSLIGLCGFDTEANMQNIYVFRDISINKPQLGHTIRIRQTHIYYRIYRQVIS